MLVKNFLNLVLKAYKQSMNSNDVISWETSGQAKIVLAVENEETLLSFYEKAKKSGINSCTIKDAGRTQVEAGTTTVCAIGPAKVSIIDSITGNLSLL
jgi:PTH2 family peptidyl-tRNA hydrolase